MVNCNNTADDRRPHRTHTHTHTSTAADVRSTVVCVKQPMADIETIVIDSSDSEQGPTTSDDHNMETATTPTNESEILLPKSNLT